MKKYYILLLLALVSMRMQAQTDREFWFVAPEVTTAHDDNRFYPEFNKTYRGGEPIFFRISTQNKPSTVIITQPANSAFDTIKLTIPANTLKSINLTDLGLQAMVENQYGTDGKGKRGIHIESTELITVYYEVYTKNNPDIFALKGRNALGTEFYTPFQNTAPNNYWASLSTRAYHAANIVATKDNTVIKITPTNPVQGGYAANVEYSITLQKGETYSMCPANLDVNVANKLSGSKITSNFPIAVTIDDDSGKYPSNSCFDLMGDQLVPTSIIGTEYIVVKGQLNMGGRPAGYAGESVYITATQNGTNVFVNGVWKATLAAGKNYIYELKNTETVAFVKTDLPVYAMHLSGFGCELGYTILPPTNKCTGSTQVAFARSTSEGFFINLLVRKNAYDGFLLNGKPLLTNLSDWTVIPGNTTWLAARIDLTAVVPNLQQSLMINTKDIFHLGLINGGTATGCRYGYFSDFNELKIDAITVKTSTGNIRVCYGEPVRLEAYGGNNFHWSPSDFMDDSISQFPTVTPYSTTKYTVSVSGACNMVGTDEVTVEVAPRIKSIFNLDTTTACAPYTFALTNVSTGATDGYKWLYDDGSPVSTSALPVQYHTYYNKTDSAVKHTVKLIAKNLESCRDTMVRIVNVLPEITANFKLSDSIKCSPLSPQFTNLSIGARGTTPYSWEFGDGASSNDSLPSHEFINKTKKDTTYSIRLITENQFYCSDTIIKKVLVHPYIKANFELDPDKSCNPYSMTINNTSIGVDNYNWSFGDGQSSTASTAQVSHLYDNKTAVTQSYSLQEVVSNVQGCKDTLTRMVTVYPSITADFTTGVTTGCDSLKVTFTNKSIGAVSYKWDFGDGSSDITPSPSHIYRNFGTSSVVYRAKLTTISANNLCSATKSIDITVHPYISASFTVNPSESCNPYNATINNKSIGVDTYDWSFGDSKIGNSSAASFVHLYNNTTTSTQIYPLTLKVSNAEGCSATLTQNIKVYPTIIATFTTDKTGGCDSTKIQLKNMSSGASNYYWTFGDGASDSRVDTSHVYRNLGTTAKAFTIKLLARSSNLLCVDSMSKTITINPYVKASFSFDPQAACSPYNTTITNSSVNVKTYAWDFGDNTTSATNVASHIHNYVNSTASKQDRVLRLVVKSAEGCADSMKKTLSVYPAVKARFSAQGGCSPVVAKTFNNATTNATIYEWSFGDGGTATIQNPGHTFLNASNTANVNYKISLKASSIYGCSDSHDTTITIIARPKASFDFGGTTGCSPYTFTVYNKSVGQAGVDWDFGDGTAHSTANVDSLKKVYANATRFDKNYTLTLIANNNAGCKDTLSRTVTVYPAITSEFSISSGCHPHVITDFKNTSVGALTYLWTIGSVTMGNQSPTYKFSNFDRINDTVVTVSLKTTSRTGCTATSSQTITVHPKPHADFFLGASTGCSPYKQIIENKTIGAISLAWDFGNGDPISNTTVASFSHDYSNNTRITKIYPITLIAETAYGCKDTLQSNLLVEPPVTAEFKISSGCEPHLISDFQNTSVGANTYSWDFGDKTSSSSQKPTHLFRNNNTTKDTTYKISLLTESKQGCKATRDTTISVYHKPTANFNIPNSAGCSPWLDTIKNQTIGADSLVWNFGDGKANAYSKLAQFTYLYENTTGVNNNFDMTLITFTNKGCSDTTIRTSTIYSAVTAKFAIASGCHPLTLTNFNNTTVGATFYNWDFGDGNSSNVQNPTHTFTNFSNTLPVSYKVNLTAQSNKGCVAKKDTSIIVNPQPLSKFVLKNEIGCAPLTVAISNQAVGGDSVRWNYGDASPITINKTLNHTHVYNNLSGVTINDTITMFVFNKYGCSDTSSGYTKIYSDVVAKFSATSGCHPHTISNFKNSSSSFTKKYFWNFGDASTSNVSSPSHLFTNVSNTSDASYKIQLIVETAEACRDTVDTSIRVYHLPLAKLQLSDEKGCSPRLISIANQSIGADSLVWDYGDGSAISNKTQASQTYLYTNATGTTKQYITTLRAFTKYSCSDTATAQSEVWSSVRAQFTAKSDCHPNVITDFKNTSSPNNITQWAWTFGDGTSSGEKNPSHTFNNFSNTTNQSFKIKLKVASPENCSDSLDTVIIAYPRSKPDFSVDNAPGCSPYTVKFTNKTIGASNITWYWGDTAKTQSLAANLTHLYQWRATDMKNFDIKAVSTTSYGCKDSVTHVAGIYPDITAQFTLSSGCEPWVVLDFKNTSIGVTKEAAWNFGDGSSASIDKPIHTFRNYDPIRDTTFKISLNNTSKYGCKAQKDTTISIYHKPDAEFSILNSPGCSPYPIKIAHQSRGAVKYSWNFGDSSIDSTAAATLSHTYTLFADDLKVYPVVLVATSPNGCKDTVQRGATIFPSMSSEFVSATEGCSPLNIVVYNNSFGANKHFWDFGDHATASLTTVDSVTHSYYNPSNVRDTTFILSLKTTSKYGCTAFSDTLITVFANPKANFAVSPSKICSPDTIQLQGKSIGATMIHWDFADNSTLNETSNHSFKHTFRNTDSLFKVFNIRQIVQNDHNCYDSTNREVHVDPDITSVFDANIAGCSPLTVVTKNKSIGAAKHEWVFGDKNGQTVESTIPVSHTYYNLSNTRDTSFVLSLKTTSRYGCTAFSDTVIKVYYNPKADFSVNNSPICSPNDIEISSKTIGAKTISWNFADGKTAIDTENKTFKHRYTNSKSSYVINIISQIATNSHQCTDTMKQDARINPDITSSFTVNLTGCNPLTIKTKNNSIGVAQYEWDFGDGTRSSEKEPPYTYFNYNPLTTAKYTIKLKTISDFGCSAESDTVVTIFPNPKADFKVERNADCSPFNVKLTNISEGASMYSWSFGDGNTSDTTNNSFIHQYRNTEKVSVSRDIVLIATNPQKCTDTIKRIVTVYPEVTAAFSGNFTGCEPLVTVFKNESLLSNTYEWTFGDGAPTSVTDPVHTYLNDQIINKDYAVRLIAKSQYGCLDTVDHTVTVFPSPDADFDVVPKKQVFPIATIGKANIRITDKTNHGVWKYNWQFGDGEESSQEGHVTHDYAHWNESGKSYTIRLQVTGENGCTDTVSQNVIVTSPIPEPHFTISAGNGCPPFDIKFANTSDYANSVLWEFKDGTQSQELEPTHTFYKTGSYRVTMTAIGDGGSAKIDTTITIHQMPIADFSINSPRLYLPDDKLKTTNLSSYASTYLWNFGDGATSEEFQPEHLYEKDGVYDLRLTVTTDKGCVDDTIVPSAVTVEAPCSISLPNAFTPNTSTANPDGRYAGLEATNDLFYPAILQKGIDAYHLEIFNKWGELLWATDKKEAGWDGYYRGQLCPLDVYVWKLKATCLDGKKIEKAGDVTLIR